MFSFLSLINNNVNIGWSFLLLSITVMCHQIQSKLWVLYLDYIYEYFCKYHQYHSSAP